MKNDITASIVLFNNNYDELKPIIKLVNESNLRIKLIFIDNSKHPNNEFVKNINNKFIYKHSKNNLGYGKGQNEALKIIYNKSKFHIFLSYDIKLEKNFFNDVFTFMLNHEQIFICVPKILNYDKTIQLSIRNFPTPMDLFIRLLPKSFKIFESKKDVYEVQRRYGHNEYMSVPVASGAVVIFKNKISLDKILFDNRYFMYMEDVDWCSKIRTFYEIYYNPNIVIYHKKNAASKKNIYMFFVHLYSAIKYFNKWGWIKNKPSLKFNKLTRKLSKNDLKKLI